MLPEIKPGMIVDVAHVEDDTPHPYFVSKCADEFILAYPLFDKGASNVVSKIAGPCVKGILGETLMQYMTKIRNQGYLGTVCQSANSHETAVVTEYCSSGTVRGVKLEDGSPWETDWPIKVADSIYEYYTKRKGELP